MTDSYLAVSGMPSPEYEESILSILPCPALPNMVEMDTAIALKVKESIEDPQLLDQNLKIKHINIITSILCIIVNLRI